MVIGALVLDYVEVLVWPLVVLTVLLAFKQQLVGLINRLQSGEVDALGVKLRLELVEVSRQAQKEADRTEGPSSTFAALAREFATYFDRGGWDFMGQKAGIMRAFSAWIDVVARAASLTDIHVTREEANTGGGSYTVELKRLRERGIISAELFESARSLNRAYSQSFVDGSVDPALVAEFRQAALDLSVAMARSISRVGP